MQKAYLLPINDHDSQCDQMARLFPQYMAISKRKFAQLKKNFAKFGSRFKIFAR